MLDYNDGDFVRLRNGWVVGPITKSGDGFHCDNVTRGHEFLWTNLGQYLLSGPRLVGNPILDVVEVVRPTLAPPPSLDLVGTEDMMTELQRRSGYRMFAVMTSADAEAASRSDPTVPKDHKGALTVSSPISADAFELILKMTAAAHNMIAASIASKAPSVLQGRETVDEVTAFLVDGFAKRYLMYLSSTDARITDGGIRQGKDPRNG